MTYTPAIGVAAAQVEAIRQESLANIRVGKACILTPGSEIGERFEAAYQTWMTLRAQAGDRFALSLGYGPKSHQEAS